MRARTPPPPFFDAAVQDPSTPLSASPTTSSSPPSGDSTTGSSFWDRRCSLTPPPPFFDAAVQDGPPKIISGDSAQRRTGPGRRPLWTPSTSCLSVWRTCTGGTGGTTTFWWSPPTPISTTPASAPPSSPGAWRAWGSARPLVGADSLEGGCLHALEGAGGVLGGVGGAADIGQIRQDAVYALPFAREVHPMYAPRRGQSGAGPPPARR